MSRKKSPTNNGFVLIGAAGYIAPRHMRAIAETGNRIVAALDPSDSVGILDSYNYNVEYFREEQELVSWFRENRGKAKYTSVCSPNWLHTKHVVLALEAGTNVICEKPLVIDPGDLELLKMAEEKSGRCVSVVLQLRYHPVVLALKRKLKFDSKRLEVSLRYVTPRGLWYHRSWKGDEDKGGGLPMNIGIHFLDMLIWLFGSVQEWEMTESSPYHVAGKLALEHADIDWFLSINKDDLREGASEPMRSLRIGEEYIEFSKGFTDLHTVVYREILEGRGYGIVDAEPALRLVSDMHKESNEEEPKG